MRFGSRSHDPEPEKVDATLTGERDRLVRTLRNLADRIEAAPSKRMTESMTWLATAAGPFIKAVERALGAKK